MNKTATIHAEHPGAFIQEELEARRWEQADLAYILGISPQQLSPIINGKQSITPAMAVALGDAFDVSPEFFANLQKLYDLHRAKKPDPGVKARATWQSVFPVREMIRRGWLEDDEEGGDPALLDLQLLRFFGKNRIEDIPFVGSGELPSFAAKMQSYEETTAVQYVWLHRVKKIAEGMKSPPYSMEALFKALPSIRRHMQDKDDLAHIPQILLECGVRFVLVEALPGSKIDGVCVWLGDQPAIGMTTRLNRMDNFCHVLRHECEHVLRGHGKELTYAPVDEFEYDLEDPNLPPDEVIANLAAAEFLIPKNLLDSFVKRKSPFISEDDVIAFAARMEINPAVVIGQIQRKTKNYAWLRKYQTGIREYLMGWDKIDGWGNKVPAGL